MDSLFFITGISNDAFEVINPKLTFALNLSKLLSRIRTSNTDEPLPRHRPLPKSPTITKQRPHNPTTTDPDLNIPTKSNQVQRDPQPPNDQIPHRPTPRTPHQDMHKKRRQPKRRNKVPKD